MLLNAWGCANAQKQQATADAAPALNTSRLLNNFMALIRALEQATTEDKLAAAESEAAAYFRIHRKEACAFPHIVDGVFAHRPAQWWAARHMLGEFAEAKIAPIVVVQGEKDRELYNASLSETRIRRLQERAHVLARTAPLARSSDAIAMYLSHACTMHDAVLLAIREDDPVVLEALFDGCGAADSSRQCSRQCSSADSASKGSSWAQRALAGEALLRPGVRNVHTLSVCDGHTGSVALDSGEQLEQDIDIGAMLCAVCDAALGATEAEAEAQAQAAATQGAPSNDGDGGEGGDEKENDVCYSALEVAAMFGAREAFRFFWGECNGMPALQQQAMQAMQATQCRARLLQCAAAGGEAQIIADVASALFADELHCIGSKVEMPTHKTKRFLLLLWACRDIAVRAHSSDEAVQWFSERINACMKQAAARRQQLCTAGALKAARAKAAIRAVAAYNFAAYRRMRAEGAAASAAAESAQLAHARRDSVVAAFSLMHDGPAPLHKVLQAVMERDDVPFLHAVLSEVAGALSYSWDTDAVRAFAEKYGRTAFVGTAIRAACWGCARFLAEKYGLEVPDTVEASPAAGETWGEHGQCQPTPVLLYVAHKAGAWPFLAWLLEGKRVRADANVADGRGRNILHYACEGGDAETVAGIVHYIMRNGEISDTGDADGVPPWLYALRNAAHGEAILRLCRDELGVDTEQAGEDGVPLRSKYAADSAWLAQYINI